jgi:hypothetical protein
LNQQFYLFYNILPIVQALTDIPFFRSTHTSRRHA